MGERRYRAAKIAGLETVPAIVRTDIDDRLHAELALLENVQRSDLTPIEAAHGYQQLRDLGMAVTEIAAKVGVQRARSATPCASSGCRRRCRR